MNKKLIIATLFILIFSIGTCFAAVTPTKVQVTIQKIEAIDTDGRATTAFTGGQVVDLASNSIALPPLNLSAGNYCRIKLTLSNQIVYNVSNVDDGSGTFWKTNGLLQGVNGNFQLVKDTDASNGVDVTVTLRNDGTRSFGNTTSTVNSASGIMILDVGLPNTIAISQSDVRNVTLYFNKTNSISVENHIDADTDNVYGIPILLSN